MAHHNDTGARGEALAVSYFEEKGFHILHRNWRHKNWEIDLICSCNNMLHFIEVKTRTSYKFGNPEDNVDASKVKFLVSAAEEFLYLHPTSKRIQFDILSILILKNAEVEYFLIEDVYL